LSFWSDQVRRIWVTLPAYNEEKSLPPLLEAFEQTIAASSLGEWHLIVVNDGSRDATLDVLRRYGQRLPLRVVSHEKNRGLGEAIKTGFRAALEIAADDDIVVGLDADDTHPPDAIPGMVKVMEETGAEVVIASRYRRGSRQVGVPLRRQLLSAGARVLFHVFLRLPGVRDYTCGFRAYRAGLLRRAFEKFGEGLITRKGFACTDELLVHLAILGPTMREVPFILRYDRKQGVSKLDLGVTVVETLRLLWGHRRELRSHARNPPR
jgi:dolichol-phosphate mannosyltransferase